MDNKIECLRAINLYREKGITLWVDEDTKLCFKAPKGGLEKDHMDFLKQNKDTIIKLLIENRGEDTKFPLTDIQSAYLLGRLETFDYGGVACQIYMEMEYPELDVDKTNCVWNKLIERHEMLRAVIQSDGYQLILSEAPKFNIRYEDLTKEVNDDRLNEIRNEEAVKKAEIDKWPFFNIAVSKLKNKCIMHVKFDFLIADWASIWILISEFEKLYENLDYKLKNLDFSFREYLRIESGLKQEKKYIEDKNYWMDRINTIPAELSVPINDKKELKNKFKRKFYQMSFKNWSKFKEQALKNGCTPTAVVLSVYCMCLARWNQSDNFIVNLTLLNRLPLHKSINEIIGDFTSVNLLEVSFEKEESFIENVKIVEKRMFQDLDHRTFSGVKVLREIRRKEGQEETIYPYVFTSSIGLMSDKDIKGRIGEYGISQTPQVFIDCQAMDNENGLRVNWDIREGVFPEGLVEDMFEAFCSSLNKLIDFEKSWNEKVFISLPENQANKRSEVNNMEKIISEESLHESVFKQIERVKNNIAVVDETGEISYEYLGNLAKEISFNLREKGCKKGDKVGIVIPKSHRQIASALGILITGGAYVPIDDKQPTGRINSIVETADIDIIITNSDFDYESIKCKDIIFVDKLEINEEHIRFIEICESRQDDLAYIIFTSGSTGTPKGVQITHGAANNTIKDINERFKVNEKDSILGLSKLSFDLSVYDIFGLLSVGGKIVFPDEKSYLEASHWYNLVRKHYITVWNTVPALMQMFLSYLKEKHINNISLQVVLLSGDWIPVTIGEEIWKHAEGAKVIGLGGATEAAIWSNYHILNENDSCYKSIPYGFPLSNQRYRVLNSKMEDCPDWVTGELCILGKGLSLGYIKDDEKTKESFPVDKISRERLYRTGDFGYYHPNGEIIFLGRKDDRIKLRGYRVELGEIENVLKKNEKIKDSYAVLHEDKNIFVVVIVDSEISVKEIEDYLRNNIPGYMIPNAIKIIDKIPLSSNGKVDRKEIKNYYKEYLKENKANMSIKSSNNELEKEIIKLLGGFLGSANITADSNVYDFGADSLIISQFIGQLKEKLEQKYNDIELSFDGLLRQLLNVPKVNKLVEYIEDIKKESDKTIQRKEVQDKKKHIGLFSEYGDGQDGIARLVFHAGLGTMNCFRHLLKNLDKQQLGPIIGITVQDINRYCEIESEHLIEEIAKDYADQVIEKEIKEVQLIGYCMGGLIALEVARRLSESDVLIKDFTLIDSAPVNHDINPCIALELIFITNFYITVEQVYEGITNKELMDAIIFVFIENNQILTEESLWQLKDYEQYSKEYRFLKDISNLSIEKRFEDYANAIKKVTGEYVPIEMLLNSYKMYTHSFKASKVNPLAYFGDIRFLEAQEDMDFIFTDKDEARSFWKDICIGDLEIIPINGNHITCIEDKDNAEELARLVGKPLF